MPVATADTTDRAAGDHRLDWETLRASGLDYDNDYE